jgi:hypothetical protein
MLIWRTIAPLPLSSGQMYYVKRKSARVCEKPMRSLEARPCEAKPKNVGENFARELLLNNSTQVCGDNPRATSGIRGPRRTAAQHHGATSATRRRSRSRTILRIRCRLPPIQSLLNLFLSFSEFQGDSDQSEDTRQELASHKVIAISYFQAECSLAFRLFSPFIPETASRAAFFLAFRYFRAEALARAIAVVL